MTDVLRAVEWLDKCFTHRSIFKDIEFYLKMKEAGTLDLYVQNKIFYEIMFLVTFYPYTSLDRIEHMVKSKMDEAIKIMEKQVKQKGE